MKYPTVPLMLLLAACSPDTPDEAAREEQAAVTEAPVTEAPVTEAAPPQMQAPTAEPQADARPAAFAICATCHQAQPDGRNGVGPNLWGVYGRSAGSVAGFFYSPAMKDSGIVWDEASLDAFIANPRAKVPGTRMAFAGLQDDAKRAELIDWLKTLQ